MLKEEKSLRQFIKLILEQNSNEEIENAVEKINRLRSYIGLSEIDIANLENTFDKDSNAKSESIRGLTRDRNLIYWLKKYKKNPSDKLKNKIQDYAESLNNIVSQVNAGL